MAYDAPDPPPTEELADEDGRYLRKIKRSLDDEVDGINPPVGEPRGQKSRVFGMWVADVKNAWGDRSKFPVIANSRDLQLFKKVLQYDTLTRGLSCARSGYVLQKAVEQKLRERELNEKERLMFQEAKILEITEPRRRERNRIHHRSEGGCSNPSRPPTSSDAKQVHFDKESPEIDQGWKAKARWILLGHRDPGVLKLERYSPTPSTTTVYLTFQIISSLGYRLVVMDVSSAFGQKVILRKGPTDHYMRRCHPVAFLRRIWFLDQGAHGSLWTVQRTFLVEAHGAQGFARPPVH